MPIDQNKLKTTLSRIAAGAITAFADDHRDEQFYGFAFDCNADYCQVLLCLNTEEDLQNTAKKLKEAPPTSFLPKFDKMMEEKYGLKPEPKRWHDDKTVAQLMEQLRWETGDWKYPAFYSCSDDPEWTALEAEISEEYDLDSDREPFMEAVCSVLRELEGSFDRLNRTSSFRALAIDHDESVEQAWRRLERVQAQEGPGQT